MIRSNLILLFFILFSNSVISQTIALRKVVSLPTLVKETSGVTTTVQAWFWTHNDSGNDPAIYKIDTFGTVLKTITIKNSTNVDWEEITRDDNNNLYIGDFGNAFNNRKDLKIYKISDPDKITGDTISAEVIDFSYSNQHQFPPSTANLMFDEEAMFYFNDFLYLFTKNRTNPYNGYTYLFKIPTIPGNYSALLLDSFKIGEGGFKEMWWITSASITPDHKKIALLSSGQMFIFSDFTDDNFLKGKMKQVDLNSFSQKEAIVFFNNTDFYITDEYNNMLQNGMNLYAGSIKELYSVGLKPVKKKTKHQLLGYISSTNGNKISLLDGIQEVRVTVTDLSGREVEKIMLNKSEASAYLKVAQGRYVLNITDGKVNQVLLIWAR